MNAKIAILLVMCLVLSTFVLAGNLVIEDLDITVGEEEDNNVVDGDTISDEAKPGDEISMVFNIENNFTEDIDIEDVELTVECDDLDVDEFEDVGTIRDGNDEEVTIEFTIPNDAEKDTYEIEIHVEGEDENGLKHEVDWIIELDVDRERNEVIIDNVQLTAPKVDCAPRTTNLLVKLENTGENNQKDAMVRVYSAAGIDALLYAINIDSTEKVEERLPILIDEDIPAGTYTVSVKSYYEADRDSYDDVRSVDLIVADCTEDSDTTDGSDSSDTTTESTTTGSGTTTTDTASTTDSEEKIVTSTPTTSTSSGLNTGDVRGTNGYTVVLIILIVAVVVISVALIARLAIKK